MESSSTARGRGGAYVERAGLLERAGLSGMDGWMAFSALGLLACSLFTLHEASGRRRQPTPIQGAERLRDDFREKQDQQCQALLQQVPVQAPAVVGQDTNGRQSYKLFN